MSQPDSFLFLSDLQWSLAGSLTCSAIAIAELRDVTWQAAAAIHVAKEEARLLSPAMEQYVTLYN